jgi:hypothetical protein
VNARLPATPLVLCVSLACAAAAKADQEAPNYAYVEASSNHSTSNGGDRYAKCVPSEKFGTEGKTYIYRVRDGNDQLLETYDWFTFNIHVLAVGKSTSVVRFGPWNRGHEPSEEHLALAFYLDGKLLKRYSTLDIVGPHGKISSSVSHYMWRAKVHGYCWLEKEDERFQKSGFSLETVDGHVISFDYKSGEILSGLVPEHYKGRRLSEGD